MLRYCLLLSLTICFIACDPSTKKKPSDALSEDFKIGFERTDGDSTSTYPEVIQFYKYLADKDDRITLEEVYETDIGKPLHLVKFIPAEVQDNPLKFLINNGIHPGESDGIDATMLLFKALSNNEWALPDAVELYAIPVYNVGGALNRNSTSRVNQNGPAAYGFRGNARNFDLNRDFIKSDTKNSKAFYSIFHQVNPDVFVDTHVSNGADYQYTLTHLFTQHNKLGGELSRHLETKFIPAVENQLSEKDWEITPYVNVNNESPEKGFTQFNDSPRYSTGYTALWNTLGLMIETHMLKPYPKRVEGTLEMLKTLVQVSQQQKTSIQEARKQNVQAFAKAKTYPLNFQVDSSSYRRLEFLGYELENLTSEITKLPRIKFRRDKPYEKEVSYYNVFKPTDSVVVPKAYIIPKQWSSIVELMNWNNIDYERFAKDTVMEVEEYSIVDFKTRRTAYEGHYLHSGTKVRSKQVQKNFSQGDVLVNTNQPGLRYLIETLEPVAVDSFFNWNFFDSILQQKEGFSPYVFEDLAIEIFNNNPELKAKFEEKQNTEPEFAKNWYAQLDWIHKHSNSYEKAHLTYPVVRVLN
ncbi:M14 family metallopeptidase [Psychroflexus sp. YR1-1]|uniref:M14 family metallopeptidase n=1 Tax=Psychroflexus aurantiacus TaxID=2709310 RepID=A0A6B3R0I3_9FLAO|nr:M14 family metallopeptidase [Psychroflexus aurantiacus]NEV94093.1 M14 family metallopeptidase [Psychroflexus aurantiacus]